MVAMSSDVATTSVHSDFRGVQWTKPAIQFVILSVLLAFGGVLALLRRDFGGAGFALVMLIAASGPFLLICRNQSRSLREFSIPASVAYASSPAIPVRMVLFEFIENRLKVRELKITDTAGSRVLVTRVILSKGHGHPPLAEEVEGVARIDEAGGIAIAEHDRYRMWCKIISSESTEVPSLPPLEP
jgi:hypothetical protein